MEEANPANDNTRNVHRPAREPTGAGPHSSRARQAHLPLRFQTQRGDDIAEFDESIILPCFVCRELIFVGFVGQQIETRFRVLSKRQLAESSHALGVKAACHRLQQALVYTQFNRGLRHVPGLVSPACDARRFFGASTISILGKNNSVGIMSNLFPLFIAGDNLFLDLKSDPKCRF